MKKYLRMVCNVCRRSIDQQVDNKRVTTDKCVITFNCQGRLSPFEYRSNAEIAVAPEAGITDWYQRGKTTSTSPQQVDPVLVNTSTGTTQQLVMAVELAAAPLSTATAVLELVVRADTPRAFKRFTYRFDTTFTVVSGVETALEKKTLRYTATGMDPDVVEVYVNGIKVESGIAPDQYRIYLGLPGPAQPNTVVFNTPVSLPGSTQVDVVVSKAAVSTVSQLTFFKNVDNPARTFTGAWENIDSFTRFVGGSWRNFYVFTYDVLGTADLDLNTIMAPSSNVLVYDAVPVSVPLTSVYFLLARSPFTTIDRYPDVSIRLDTLSLDRDYLKYHAVSNVPTLDVTQTSIEAFFPPARLTKFDPEPTIKTASDGVDDQITIDGSVIVGPDT